MNGFAGHHAGAKPRGVKELGASVGGFVKADDAKYEVVREMAEAAEKLAAPK